MNIKKEILKIIAGLVIGAFAGFLFVSTSHYNSKVKYYQTFGGIDSNYIKCTRVPERELNDSDKGILVEMTCPFGNKGLYKDVRLYAPKKRRIGIYYPAENSSWQYILSGNSREITIVRSDLKFVKLQKDKNMPYVVIYKIKKKNRK